MNDLFSKTVIAALMACWIFLTVLLLSTDAGSMSVPPPTPSPVEALPPLPPTNPADVFETYLGTDIPPAAGFDFPVGNPDGDGSYTDLASGKSYDGWYVSVRFGAWYSYGLHPGEDWNGVGGGNTDLGQPVHAVASGRVVFAADCGQPSGGVVAIEHLYYHNGDKQRIASVYRHLDAMRVKQGDVVHRRQILGALGRDPEGKFHAHLHFEMRRDLHLSPTYWPSAHGKNADWLRAHYANPSAFIRGHRQLFVPQHEPHLVLVDAASSRMRLYQHGRLQAQFTVGLGPGPAAARLPGDQRVLKGMYFVVGCNRRRVAINYPNRYDAARARQRGLLSHREEAEVRSAWQSRRITPGDTALGGGLAITNGPPVIPGDRMPPPGTILMRGSDFAHVVHRVPERAMVIIF